MSALEWARQLLASASNSQGSVEASQLPSRAGTLVDAWCDALRDPESPSEDKEVVIRALRCCRFADLPSASPTLHRFAATALRILNTLVLKIQPLTPDIVASLTTILSTWIYYGSSPVGSASPAVLDRGRAAVLTQLSFGVMSAFMQAPTTPPRRRKGSTASIASSRASSAGRDGATSESEDEGRTVDRRDSAQLRRDALVCLRSLATASPRALHKHWHLFLADSPYLRSRSTVVSLIEHDPSRSVRLQACAALDALLEDSSPYLALAEDRSTSSSFTSLSTKLGEIVSELHLSLSSLLAVPLSPDRHVFHLALLALAAKVARNSPYGRMKRSLARQLSKAVLSSLGSSDLAVVVASASTLAVIVSRYVATSSSQPLDGEEIASAAALCLRVEQPAEVEAAGWTLLASLVPVLPAHDWSAELALFAGADSPSCALAEARTAFLVALSGLSPSSAAPALPSSLASLLAASLASPHPSVRALACTALPGPALSALLPSGFSPWRAALALAAQDAAPLVQRAAVRALGLLAKAEHALRALGKGEERCELQEALDVLLQTLERSEVAREGETDVEADVDVGGTAWALANCCDALSSCDVAALNPTTLLRASVDLLASELSDEQSRTGALRILASTVRHVSLEAPLQLLEDCITAIEGGLTHPAAKVWEARKTVCGPGKALPVAIEPHSYAEIDAAKSRLDEVTVIFKQLCGDANDTSVLKHKALLVLFHKALLAARVYQLTASARPDNPVRKLLRGMMGRLVVWIKLGMGTHDSRFIAALRAFTVAY
ncbi:hypothetical protein JCM10450v2_003649 [Rhodotorula kratochvilovae]